MKKILVLAVTVLFLVACQPNEQKKGNDEKKANAETPMLLGIVSAGDLQEQPYGEWFNKNEQEYVVDSATMAQVDLSAYKVLVIFGTWCGDSRREVPRFVKLMNYIHFSNYELCAVDRSKLCKNKSTEDLNIERVPTFIFYKDGKEMGRIIESPQSSLEMDMFSITGSEE